MWRKCKSGDKMQTLTPEQWHIEFSRKGGKAGRGVVKRRSYEHYVRAQKLSMAAQRMKKQQPK